MCGGEQGNCPPRSCRACHQTTDNYPPPPNFREDIWPPWGKVLNAALNCILKLRLWAFFWYPQLKTTLCSKWTVFLYPVTLLGLGFERSKSHHSNIGVNDHGLFPTVYPITNTYGLSLWYPPTRTVFHRGSIFVLLLYMTVLSQENKELGVYL